MGCLLLVMVAPASAATTTPRPTVVGGERLAGHGVVTDLPPGVPVPPDAAAASYVVADLGTGEVIAAKAAHAPHLPASALKSLTALTVLPLVDQGQLVKALAGDVVDGSKVGIAPGSHYTVRQLLQGMMLSSGNDAATAVARAAGGVPLTVARMQAQAEALGARDTVVRNPSGLDAKGQVTSAYDLALVARAGMARQDFRELVATRHADFPGKEVSGKHRKTYQIQNHNRLLANYDGAVGVKNGYTVAARWTVVGAATRGGRSYVVVALARKDGSWRPTAALLDWAFTNGDRARPVGRLVGRGEIAGSAPGDIVGSASGDVAGSASGDVAGSASGDTAASAASARAGRPGPGDERRVAAAVPATTRASASADAPWSLAQVLAVAVGVLAVVLLVLAVLLRLSARARQRQLRAARAARSAPRRPR